MNFLSEPLENYIESHCHEEDNVLKKLNRETHASILMPQMLSGHLQGIFLTMLSKMIKPRQILEIGTFTGYSAICLSQGLQEGGMLHTIDINEELLHIVKRYLKESGVEQKVKTYTGNALDIIPGIKEEFDLVFIDADKKNYTNYYHLVFNKVKPGGFIIADNVLWSGKVLEKPKESDEETRGIMEYNDNVTSDKRVENIIIPLRDGLMIARKLHH
jgi:caffeoyl-CoA O-methyltransferase